MVGNQVARLEKLINYFAAHAKSGVLTGQFEQIKASAIAAAQQVYSQAEVAAALGYIHFEPEKRVEHLVARYSDPDWIEWAKSWALPQEIEYAVALVNSMTPTTLPTPATQVQPEQPPPAPDTHTYSPLIARGLLLEQGFRAFGVNVSLVHQECSDSGLRCDRLVFSKPVEMPYNAPQKCLAEALSNANIDPEIGVNLKRLPGNRFEVQLPRPQEEWKDAHLLQYLSDRQGARIIADDSKPAKDRILAFTSHLRTLHNVLPQNAPKVPILVDLEGKLFWADLSSHMLIGGGSKGGKSTQIKTILYGLMLLYPSEWLQFVLMDFKKGVTLSKFSETEWSWQGLSACVDPKDAETRWRKLETEADRRAEQILRAGVENIQEYNALHPRDPIPWIVVVADEIGNYKTAVGDSADEWLQLCMSQWRAWGIVFVGSTQYPSAKYALGPDTRTNFQTRVLFACDKRCADLVFGEGDRHSVDATRLIPPGDCIVKYGGRHIRGQALFVSPAVGAKLSQAYERPVFSNPFDQAFSDAA